MLRCERLTTGSRRDAWDTPKSLMTRLIGERCSTGLVPRRTLFVPDPDNAVLNVRG